MKRIITLLLIVSVAFSLIGCDLFGAAKVYDRYELDAEGNEIRVQVMHAPGNKSEIWLERYYNKDGWLEREISYASYAEGKIGYDTFFRQDGTRTETTTYVEDTNEYMIEKFDENDVCSICYTYDGTKLIAVEEFYSSGERSKVTYYTDPNYYFTSYHFATDGTEIAYHAKWTENGNVYEEFDVLEGRIRISSDMYVTTVDGDFVEHYLAEYAPNGEMTKTIHYDKDGNVYDDVEHH